MYHHIAIGTIIGENGIRSEYSHLSTITMNFSDINMVTRISMYINITGIAPEEFDIFSYARSLRSSGRFSLVVISSIAEKVEEVEEEDEEEEEEEIRQFEFEFLLH